MGLVMGMTTKRLCDRSIGASVTMYFSMTTGITHMFSAINHGHADLQQTTPDHNGIPVVKQGRWGGTMASQEAIRCKGTPSKANQWGLFDARWCTNHCQC